MNRILLFTALAAIFMVMLFIANCSDPLETINSKGYIPTEPGGDTVFHFDTVIVIDSLIHVDTVIVSDSTGHVDTVIIVEPGPSGPQLLCSRMACNQQEIIWMFRNPEGRFRLEFAASTERGHPTQLLLMSIDGQLVTWNTAVNLELTLEQSLRTNPTIRITSDKPHALGHAIDICLTMTKL